MSWASRARIALRGCSTGTPGSSRTSGWISAPRSGASPPCSPRSWPSTAVASGPADMREAGSGTAPGADGTGAPHAGDCAPAEPLVDPTELLLWAFMRKFERLALECYALHAPALATVEKRRFVARLDALETDEAALAASPLAAAADELLARARSTDAVSVLIVQGLVLEHLGQAIYRVADDVQPVGVPSRAR